MDDEGTGLPPYDREDWEGPSAGAIVAWTAFCGVMLLVIIFLLGVVIGGLGLS